MDPLVYYEKGSSKMYKPFIPMVATLFKGVYELSEISSISVLNTNPKYVLVLMF